MNDNKTSIEQVALSNWFFAKFIILMWKHFLGVFNMSMKRLHTIVQEMKAYILFMLPDFSSARYEGLNAQNKSTYIF